MRKPEDRTRKHILFSSQRVLGLFGSASLIFATLQPIARTQPQPSAIPSSSNLNSSLAGRFGNYKLALVDFEDLECPRCATAFPYLRSAEQRFHIPLLVFDVQIPAHRWSHRAAIFSHYFAADNPALGEAFRDLVFKRQADILTNEDVGELASRFSKEHKVALSISKEQMEHFEREITTSTSLAHDLGVQHTPTVLVIAGSRAQEVTDFARVADIVASFASPKRVIHTR